MKREADNNVRFPIFLWEHFDKTGILNFQHLHHVIVHDGFLIERNDEISERTYVVHNAASEARNVIIEHPVRD